jgi:rhodanese-related sulfurtransferase
MVSVEELNKLATRRGEAQLVDVRTAAEYATGHVPGAVNIPMEQLEGRMDDLSPHSPIVLICHTGARARLAAALLGPCRTDVTVLDGGTSAWVKAGFPAVACAPTRRGLEQQVRIAAGVLVVVGAMLALTLNRHWAYLSGSVGLGLAIAGITGVCPLGSLLCKMPWNRSSRLRSGATSAQGQTCSLRNASPGGGDGETILS